MQFKIITSVLIFGFATACNNENPVIDVNNTPPVIQSVIFTPNPVIAGQSCIVKCIAVDSNGDKLEYEWNPQGNVYAAGGDDGTVYFTPNACCSQPKMDLKVKDGRGGEDDTFFNVPFKYDEND